MSWNQLVRNQFRWNHLLQNQLGLVLYRGTRFCKDLFIVNLSVGEPIAVEPVPVEQAVVDPVLQRFTCCPASTSVPP